MTFSHLFTFTSFKSHFNEQEEEIFFCFPLFVHVLYINFCVFISMASNEYFKEWKKETYFYFIQDVVQYSKHFMKALPCIIPIYAHYHNAQDRQVSFSFHMSQSTKQAMWAMGVHSCLMVVDQSGFFFTFLSQKWQTVKTIVFDFYFE